MTSILIQREYMLKVNTIGEVSLEIATSSNHCECLRPFLVKKSFECFKKREKK